MEPVQNDFQLAIQRLRHYATAPDGAADWIEDHVSAFITDFVTGQSTWCPIKSLPDTPHPQTGRSYRDFWLWQRDNVIIPATTRKPDGFLKYHTILLIMPRGEAKSFLSVLLLLWRLFCLPKQSIILGANSSGQSRWALYDIARDLIVNSPLLYSIIDSNGSIEEKAIELHDDDGNVMSSIRSISTSSGIYSNATAISFSELFMQAPDGKYYYQLDSSRRNVPNSQMLVDSTVSDPEHVLHRLYRAGISGDDDGILVVYRHSDSGSYKDYLHPMNTQEQLNSFRGKFTPSEFRRYFLNLWQAGSDKVYAPEVVMSIQYAGAYGELGRVSDIVTNCKKILDYESDEYNYSASVRDEMEKRLLPLPYSLALNGHSRLIESNEVRALGDLYKTHWGVGVGIDFSDPLKNDITEGARTILTVTMKGLPGSMIDPDLHLRLGDSVKYLYINAGTFHIESAEVEDAQRKIDEVFGLFGNVNSVCAERYGAERLRGYCEDNDIRLELISPTYDRQRAAFNYFYNLVMTGRYKSVRVPLAGYESEWLEEEEMLAFVYDPVKKFYGSMSKKKRQGVQDDSMYARAWGIYGLREVTVEGFLTANYNPFVGLVSSSSGLVGRYT